MNGVAIPHTQSFEPEQTGRSGAAPWFPQRSETLAVGLVLGALIVAYLPSIRMLISQWNRDPNYSYGFFVAPIAGVIFWSRRGMLERSRMSPKWWGFLPLVAVLALRYPLFAWNEQHAETATLPFAAAGLVLALGGWHLLRVALPALVFLFFMLPLPPSVNALLARPLQQLATAGSVSLLQFLGLPVMAEGNVIIIGAMPLEVARACNGLSMLLSFVTLVAAVVILVQRPLPERVILMLSAIPIALVSNIIRITATAIVYYFEIHSILGVDVKALVHDGAGWMMMPIALGLVWLELRVLSWLFVEMEDVDAGVLLRKGRLGAGR